MIVGDAGLSHVLSSNSSCSPSPSSSQSVPEGESAGTGLGSTTRSFRMRRNGPAASAMMGPAMTVPLAALSMPRSRPYPTHAAVPATRLGWLSGPPAPSRCPDLNSRNGDEVPVRGGRRKGATARSENRVVAEDAPEVGGADAVGTELGARLLRRLEPYAPIGCPTEVRGVNRVPSERYSGFECRPAAPSRTGLGRHGEGRSGIRSPPARWRSATRTTRQTTCTYAVDRARRRPGNGLDPQARPAGRREVPRANPSPRLGWARHLESHATSEHRPFVVISRDRALVRTRQCWRRKGAVSADGENRIGVHCRPAVRIVQRVSLNLIPTGIQSRQGHPRHGHADWIDPDPGRSARVPSRLRRRGAQPSAVRASLLARFQRFAYSSCERDVCLCRSVATALARESLREPGERHPWQRDQRRSRCDGDWNSS